MSGPKETRDNWLSLVPISILKHMLSSRFLRYHKYYGILILISSYPILYFTLLKIHGLPFPELLVPLWPCYFDCVLSLFSSLLLLSVSSAHTLSHPLSLSLVMDKFSILAMLSVLHSLLALDSSRCLWLYSP